ncbi:MAG: Ig-like domain repeat protein [Acidobacteria bacterium]|nr:Ig-like domain repeat protein [Acidobacteriota bacterium]
MRAALRGAAFSLVALVSALGSGCGGGGNSGGTGGGSQNSVTPIVTVSPAASTTTTVQRLKVTVTVRGGSGSPTGSVTLSAGSYTSSASVLNGGTASITIPPGSLAAGTQTLKAAYTPDAASSSAYNASSGTAPVTVSLAIPTVSVTPTSQSIVATQPSQVAVNLSGGTGAPVATGTIVLSGGSYNSASTSLAGGSANFTVPANTFTIGSVTLTAAYTPDSPGASIYQTASGQSSAISVLKANTVTIDQSGTGIHVSDQLLGMNLPSWYDVYSNASGINTAFAQAGIKAIRWPGGSWSDAYHWGQGGGLPIMCNTSGSGTGWGGYGTFPQFVSSIVQAGNYDLALTANYGSNATCNGGGDPAEAAAWVSEAVKDGVHASHVTVGNEEYGSWEYDLHAKQHDPATYASSVIGTSGYYNRIKAADASALVGVVVDADGSSSWDKTVLGNAKGSYDFVEYHFYPEAPGSESDTYLVHQAAQDLTASLNYLKSELSTAGVPNTPIYVGEMGSVYSTPGKQSWSITQGLYAGQTLGEMMNSGVVRATWWIGFGNCDENAQGGALGDMSSSLYGWQTFGAYNVFSDRPGDGPCGVGSGPLGTMSPTARAFQLFSHVAVTGESVLSTNVSGVPDIRAYAATHSGGTALVLFNLNQTVSEPVTVTLSNQSASTGVTVMTYDKAIYDQTNSANPVWAPPTTIDLGAQSLPLTLTLTPWSMNVVNIR